MPFCRVSFAYIREKGWIKMDSHGIGPKGEEVAARFLTHQGYSIVGRNIYFRFAEIDIVAKKGDVIIFVEVKTRKSMQYGLPREAVTKRKQEHIKAAAQAYLANMESWSGLCRFDVIEVWYGQGRWHIEHIQNAFS